MKWFKNGLMQGFQEVCNTVEVAGKEDDFSCSMYHGLAGSDMGIRETRRLEVSGKKAIDDQSMDQGFSNDNLEEGKSLHTNEYGQINGAAK